MTALSRQQYDFLTGGIQPNRVQHAQGQAHLQAWDIRRHLIRVFGFDGFDIETIALDLVREIETKQGDRSRWTVVYRAQVRLTIKVDGRPVAVFEDGAAGDAANQPSLGDAHDMAAKTALSQGLKRCAVNLGDQFGLSLYSDGNPAPVVLRSLVAPDGESEPVPEHQDAPVKPEPEPVTPAEEPPPDEETVPARSDTVTRAAKAIAEADTNEALAKISSRIIDKVRTGELTTGEEVELRKLMVARSNVLAQPPSGLASERKRTLIHTMFAKAGTTDRQEKLDFCIAIVARPIATTNELSADEADKVIAALREADRVRRAAVHA